jgi:hypothetical protein
VAAIAIARPVQRRSLLLLVPWWLLPAAFCISFALIVCRDAPLGARPPFNWSLSLALYGLTLAAFLVPVLAAVSCWVMWDRAKLNSQKMARVEEIFQAALRESEFDEVERILRKNRARLKNLPDSAAAALFSRPMVTAMMDSHSLIHLELLADMEFLRSLHDRFRAVDIVVRELLRSEVSPLRSTVVNRYGGIENLVYSDAERTLVERTFENPDWYLESGAHYPLVISAVEELTSGRLDSEYNSLGRNYEAVQGIATRSRCPVYLAYKTEVLAIEAAIKARASGDFYVSDLWDIFRYAQQRSKFDKAVWESSDSNGEFPTPFAYLLYHLNSDLWDLSAEAVCCAASGGDSGSVAACDAIAKWLARTWSSCIENVAGSESQVSAGFRRYAIQQYLLFVLALGWEPSEVCLGWSSADSARLEIWRDFFASELKKRFGGARHAQDEALRDAVEGLDQGRRSVFEGYDWLRLKLLG